MRERWFGTVFKQHLWSPGHGIWRTFYHYMQDTPNDIANELNSSTLSNNICAARTFCGFLIEFYAFLPLSKIWSWRGGCCGGLRGGLRELGRAREDGRGFVLWTRGRELEMEGIQGLEGVLDIMLLLRGISYILFC